VKNYNTINAKKEGITISCELKIKDYTRCGCCNSK
jgi:hypothetical protein